MTPQLEAMVGARTRRINEMQMAVACLLLGVMFAISGQVFDAGAPLHNLQWIAPASAWAIWFQFVGTVRLIVLIINGYWPLGATVRRCLSITCLATAWIPITAGYLLTFEMSLGYPAMVLSAIAVIGEVNILLALSAYRAERRRDR
jgi:ABC-type Na+ efflux pump permease subunit